MSTPTVEFAHLRRICTAFALGSVLAFRCSPLLRKACGSQYVFGGHLSPFRRSLYSRPERVTNHLERRAPRRSGLNNRWFKLADVLRDWHFERSGAAPRVRLQGSVRPRGGPKVGSARSLPITIGPRNICSTGSIGNQEPTPLRFLALAWIA